MFQFLSNNSGGSAPEEMLDLTNQHVWYNQSGWAEASIVVTNTGGRDAVLRKITIRGEESNWSNVYYWKTDTGPISDELEQTPIELHGNSFNIIIDGTQRTFQQAMTAPTLSFRWTIVLYIKDPANISSKDGGSKVTIAVFTDSKLYYEEAYVEATFTFMQTDQFNVVSATFGGTSGAADNTITLTIQNTGSSSFTIDTAAKVNGVSKTLAAQVTIAAGSSSDVTIPAVGWLDGNQYNMELLTTQGTKITWIANAPGSGYAGALLGVQNVYWNSTALTTSITVKNIGTSTTTIIRFYLGNTASNLIEVTINTDLGPTGKSLAVDQTITIVLDWPNALASSWTNGKTYYFRIVPEVGPSLDFTHKAPSV